MARERVLNPRAVPLECTPVDLSRRLLAAARARGSVAEPPGVEALAGQLHGVDPTAIEGDAARLAFWLNAYNALLLHCLNRTPIRGSLLRHLRLFDRVAYDVGGHPYALNVIEHGILRANRRPPYRLRRPLRRGDPRHAGAPAAVDPRIHFALNCGARSCPPIRVYDAARVDADLEVATDAYIAAETDLDRDGRRIALPRLMRLYRADFGSRSEQLSFVARYLPELRAWLDDDPGAVRLAYRRFDWTVAAPA